MALQSRCPQCHQFDATGFFQYGGPWLLVCANCMGRMKFGILHYQYLFQVLKRAGLTPQEANAAVAREVMLDGVTCYPASEGDLAQRGVEELQRYLHGPMPVLEVGGKLDLKVRTDQMVTC